MLVPAGSDGALVGRSAIEVAGSHARGGSRRCNAAAAAAATVERESGEGKSVAALVAVPDTGTIMLSHAEEDSQIARLDPH
jgi:hypothetical protein